jgi:aldehyde:ferredoxin oxidoreductase
MRPTTANLSRYKGMHGWANRILRIDLNDMRITSQETAPYVPAYLGARGIAGRICWDEYPEPAEPFDPANPLMIFGGALTGSRSPYSGRTTICTFSPLSYPHHWFTRSNVGARFGGELKRAGYDGIVVTGASETPVRIRIRDDEVTILPATDLWGLDTMDTLEALASADGKGVHSLVIGPAGERLSRIATIHAASSSVCGQGGYGSVMGSKKLKAITVIGSGRVSLAEPKTMTAITRTLAREVVPPMRAKRDMEKLNRQLAEEGGGTAHFYACTESCITPCALECREVPGRAHNRKWSGNWFCIGEILLPGPGEEAFPLKRSVFDWNLTTQGGFEMNVLSNRYGLDQRDILMGMAPWLVACQKAGLISDFNGQNMDWRSPHFWAEFLRAIAYREGVGDALAEGGWAAARALHLGEDLVQSRYAGWGCPGHWDGHDVSSYCPFPYWLPPALQWLSDVRDPISSGHGYLHTTEPIRNTLWQRPEEEWPAAVDRALAVGERAYGDADALSPYGEYNAKAYPAYFHTIRSVIKDCVPVDDMVFPLIANENADDGYWTFRDIEGVGDIDGLSVEYHLFRTGTGLDWSEEELNRAAQRVCTLERALQVRHWGRDRQMDESVLPYFEREESYQNPLLERRHGLDRDLFRPVMDAFYQLKGWDVGTGWPTQAKLRELDLAEVHEPMVEGATRARERAEGSAE